YVLPFVNIQLGLLQIVRRTKLNTSCICQEHCQQMLQIDLNQNKTKINNPQYIWLIQYDTLVLKIENYKMDCLYKT
uniref:Uncharacterized protein n=1 Tax=Glossina palpalis gambiensis TaxID=67801 RepID=A0A1B0AUW1_9MUSC